VRNSEYQLGLLDQIRTVQLTDGRYQEGPAGSETYISISVTDYIARGDLNGDGENEAVASYRCMQSEDTKNRIRSFLKGK